ncbi:uncharacterized protein Z518_05123 [Rhinocladiella mackenziei CBS 650.93]|uniref:Rhinocladiella mackenziei CBS 650.93 unplaced genomic scaffold supercont1.3, whole genome shotgun sequence n=1 Tax=Rhinocladiella mackenziei CBS 650.93 TaxID=1442369 RepID=A0A0D2IVC9_9EURO|nr:uncharacterized protein Z518_05123 [Rhinocladiella mackenziei CBS 650.93]KIX07146.1 hypothetical protein Z518_05123 [Rhinocladiella mackenziei CBS 650.93]
MRELKFLHQDTTKTHKTLAELFERRHPVPARILKEALAHDFLANGAWHEVSESTELMSAFAIKPSEYLEAASKKFLVLLCNIKTTSENSMFIFACIICVGTIVQLMPAPGANTTWQCLMDGANAALECLQGARKFVVATGLWEKPGPSYSFVVGLQSKENYAVVGPDVMHALER